MRNNMMFQLLDVFLEYSHQVNHDDKIDFLESYSFLSRYFKYREDIQQNSLTFETSADILNELTIQILNGIERSENGEIWLNVQPGISLFSILKLTEKLKLNALNYYNLLESQKYTTTQEDVKMEFNDFTTLIDRLIKMFKNLFSIDQLLSHDSILKDVRNFKKISKLKFKRISFSVLKNSKF